MGDVANNARHPTYAPTGAFMRGRAPSITARYPPGTKKYEKEIKDKSRKMRHTEARATRRGNLNPHAPYLMILKSKTRSKRARQTTHEPHKQKAKTTQYLEPKAQKTTALIELHTGSFSKIFENF